jgi:hypothetical protein
MLAFIAVPPGDPGDISQVTTPDQKKLGKDHGQGLKESNIVGQFFAVLFSSLIDGLEIIIRELVGLYDEVLSLFVGLVTAAQGTQTQGFYDLTASILNDLLGMELAGSEIAAAGKAHGLVGAMQKAGGDLFNVLLNEFLGAQPSVKGGPAGLPGTPGTPLSPDQGLKGAAAFLGFILSFGVRQGNLEMISTAIPESFRMFEGIRAYGELMAKNLGLGRLSRRVLTPIIQETIIGPLQAKLNVQYRPKALDPKQLAAAFIRGDIDRADYVDGLARAGYTDKNADILIADTYTRLNIGEIFTLHETGQISDAENLKMMQQLGYNSSDVPLVRKARALELVRSIDRAYIVTAIGDLHHGLIDLQTLNADIEATVLTREEKDAYRRNGANRAAARGRLLSLGFLKKAYLEAAIDLGEFERHVEALGYDQDDRDIIEQELLVEQKAAADKKKAAAAKIAAKAAADAAKKAGKTPTTPPATPGG